MGGGFGMQGSDPNLSDKLAALKQKRGNLDDKVTQFLERDLGVDPRALAFTEQQAREYVNALIEDSDGTVARFTGNSHGLIEVSISDIDIDTITIGPSDDLWHDVERAYSTLIKPVIDDQHTYSIECSLSFEPDLTITPIAAPPVKHSDPTKYPPGSVLRIEKPTVMVAAGEVVINTHYIRIGGLFDETTPTILDTMQPMTDLTGWTVTEELS